MLDFPKWKIWFVAVFCAASVFYAAPNFLDGKSSKTINLGLDLRGGSYLLLEVDFNKYVAEQLELMVDDMRSSLRKERIGYTGLGSGDDNISLKLRNISDTEKAKEIISDIARDIEIEMESDGKINISFLETYIEELKRNVIGQSIEIVRRRVDETGTREPIIQRQGDLRILLQVPGLDNPENLKNLLGKTAKMTFHLMDENNPFPSDIRRAPPGEKLLSGDGEESNRKYLIKRKVMLSGDYLVDSRATFDQGRPVVSFRFNTQGGRKFAQITKDNVGKPFAIVLDNKVISAPVIQGPILQGSGIITGNFSVQSANDLSLLLRAGALPAPLNIIEERTVGPSLGHDSIEAGKIASIVGIILVIAFMLLFYGLFGVFSNIALVMNMIIIMAALSLFQATLTLPGIAGMVLTMGMAVDANVLIFERIREEVANGKTPYAAIDQGFSQAFKTIIDSNITTLMATLLLFIYGSGPVKGFAVTLSIGILSSMFSAILLTRMMIVIWLKKTKPKSLPI